MKKSSQHGEKRQNVVRKTGKKCLGDLGLQTGFLGEAVLPTRAPARASAAPQGFCCTLWPTGFTRLSCFPFPNLAAHLAWRGVPWYLLCWGKHLPLLASETSMKKKKHMESFDFKGRPDLRFESFEQGGDGEAALAPLLSHRAWEQWSESKSGRCQIAN